MKINKISSKLIKPNTPTPQNLKNYKLSFVDVIIPPMNLAVVLFYDSKPDDGSRRLEESLARILVEFYPLAGRFIKNDSLIDCSDDGAALVEAEAPDVKLIDLVAKIELDQLDGLLPEQHFRVDEAPGNPLLSIQVTRFPCGGAAVAISVSHRIFDARSLGTFVAAWSAAAADVDHDKRVNPSFHLHLLLPQVTREDSLTPAPARTGKQSVAADHGYVLKRLLFNKEALTRLKSRIGQTNGKPLSGVRVVCAVMAGALIRLDRAVHGRSRRGSGFVVCQLVNMRERTIPPQSRHACGNFAFPAATPRIAAEDGFDVAEIVRALGDSVRDAIARHAKILSPDRDGRDIITNSKESLIKLVCSHETKPITINDWSRFGFHEADFGWGKPISTGVSCGPPASNIVVLMSDKEGDGIEAWFHLKENEVPYFEQDEEIKTLLCK